MPLNKFLKDFNEVEVEKNIVVAVIHKTILTFIMQVL